MAKKKKTAWMVHVPVTLAGIRTYYAEAVDAEDAIRLAKEGEGEQPEEDEITETKEEDFDHAEAVPND